VSEALDPAVLKERFRVLFELCLEELADLPDDHLVWPKEFLARMNDRLGTAGFVPRDFDPDEGPSMAGELRESLKQCLVDLDMPPVEVFDGARRHGL
jgi:hypothetical protein